jgi:hypothetical protein
MGRPWWKRPSEKLGRKVSVPGLARVVEIGSQDVPLLFISWDATISPQRRSRPATDLFGHLSYERRGAHDPLSHLRVGHTGSSIGRYLVNFRRPRSFLRIVSSRNHLPFRLEQSQRKREWVTVDEALRRCEEWTYKKNSKIELAQALRRCRVYQDANGSAGIGS